MCSFVQPFELPMCINCALPSFKSTSCHLYFTPKKKKCEEFKGYQTLSVTTLECFKSQKQKSEPSMDRQLVLQGCAGQLVRRREHLLSCVTLGSGVERGQLHTVKVLRPHLKQNLLKRVKLAARSIHVVLIDLDTVDKEKKKKWQPWSHVSSEQSSTYTNHRKALCIISTFTENVQHSRSAANSVEAFIGNSFSIPGKLVLCNVLLCKAKTAILYNP